MSTINTSYIDSLARENPVNARGGNNELGQEAFLALLTTQLKQQDPFKPVDQTQMIAQMAQFSSVAGISEMSKTLTEINATLSASSMADASQFIGRNALVQSNQVMADSNGTYHGEMDMYAAANDVTLQWVNQDGHVVHEQQYDSLPQGKIPLQFNSTDADGNPVDHGVLSLQMRGGAAQFYSWVPVTAVQPGTESNQADLVTPMGNVSVNNVSRFG